MKSCETSTCSITIDNKISYIEIISYLIFLFLGLFGIYITIKEFSVPLLIGSLGIIFVALGCLYNILRGIRI